MRKYAQFMSVSDYETLLENLRKQKQLSDRIKELQYYRSHLGITKFKDVEQYNKDKQQRIQNKNHQAMDVTEKIKQESVETPTISRLNKRSKQPSAITPTKRLTRGSCNLLQMQSPAKRPHLMQASPKLECDMIDDVKKENDEEIDDIAEMMTDDLEESNSNFDDDFDSLSNNNDDLYNNKSDDEDENEEDEDEEDSSSSNIEEPNDSLTDDHNHKDDNDDLDEQENGNGSHPDVKNSNSIVGRLRRLTTRQKNSILGINGNKLKKPLKNNNSNGNGGIVCTPNGKKLGRLKNKNKKKRTY